MATNLAGGYLLTWTEFKAFLSSVPRESRAVAEVAIPLTESEARMLIATCGPLVYTCELDPASSDYTDWSDNVEPDTVEFVGAAPSGLNDILLQCESDADMNVLAAVGNDWSVVTDSKHSNGYARKNLNTGTSDMMIIVHRASNVQVYGVKGPDKGKFDLWIFGEQNPYSVDCYDPTEQHRALLFDLNVARGADIGLGDMGEMEITISMTGTKNASSTGTEVVLDYVLLPTSMMKVQALVINGVENKTKILQQDKEGGSNTYTVDEGTYQHDERVVGMSGAWLIARVTNLTGTGVDIAAHQAVEVGAFDFLSTPYTPEDGAFPTMTNNEVASRMIKLLGEYLLIDVTVNGTSGQSADVELYLVARAA